MSLRAENKQLFVRLAVVAAGMFGFGYALVPFYYEICRVWQVNLLDKPDAAPVNSQVDKTRTVTIELDSNIHKIAWQFRPLVNHVSVHPGELTTVEYEVVNTRPTPVTGQAVASNSRANTSRSCSASASPSRRWPRARRGACRSPSSWIRACPRT